MKTIAFTSGKGGVGKTSVTLGVAFAAAERGKKCLVLDADMGLGNVDIALGLSAQRSLIDVVEGHCRLSEVALEVEAGVTVLPAASGILKAERLTGRERQMIAEQLCQLGEKYDWVLVDTGSGLTENVLFFNELADGVVIVSQPEPPALTDAYAILKVLSRRAIARNLSLLINAADSAMHAEEVRERLDGVCQAYLTFKPAYVGHVLSDPHVARAVRARRPLLREFPDSPASLCLRRIAARLDAMFEPAGRLQQRPWLQQHTLSRQPA